MRSTGTLIIATSFAFENPDKLASDLIEIARRNQLPEPFQVVRHSNPKTVPSGRLVMTDRPIRIAPDVTGFLAWLQALQDRDVEVFLPGLDLRHGNPQRPAQRALIEFLSGHRKLARAVRIKEGLALARKRGRVVGRQPLSDELVALALEEVRLVGSIRGAERNLRARGVQISRSAICRLVRAKGGRK